MIDRLKDLLYEISDILVAVLIVILVSGVIVWQVTDTLAFSKEQADSITVEKQPVTEVISNEPVEEPVEESVEEPSIIVEENNPSSNQAEVIPEEPKEETPPPKPVSKDVKVTIPSGSPGIKIANILQEAGLIKDSNDFVKRSSELKMDSKLKSGTYTISTSNSIDDMIYIIAGKKR
ncbi:MltG/YceG/YrrL family protein [Anaeromicrobium sediminis]|uniref:Endolytic transglycosylase MltG n=1 Tax=Anaeromicrobium sediminis TaxID=1478221 RepID=A0A267MPB6_9FIRM|nr:endolytic transglycosylase MltG [Anaeromicrobium sediminis]PAB60748.1 hypothetical protein CCE28_04210 [Anaeromicrobium sediminis]